MEPFYFHPTLLLRTPYYAYTKHKSLSLQDAMDLQPVKNAQMLAAPAFYDILKKNGFKAGALTPKQKQTVENYLNRMHYRCTPFGLFAGTLPVNWSEYAANKIILDDERMMELMPSFGIETKIAASLKNNLLLNNGFYYFANPANVLVGNELRYLASSHPSSEGSIKEYTLKSISTDKSFKQLWAFCSKPVTATAIMQYLAEHYEMDKEEGIAFLHTLIEEQLLLSNADANISGTLYPERLSQLLNEKDYEGLSLLKNELTNKIVSTEPLPEIYERQPDDEQTKSNSYAHVNMRSAARFGSVHQQHQQKISDGLYAIQKLHPYAELYDLESFKRAFLDKFDQRSVPLLEALDPELGINYAGLSHAKDQNEILEKLDGKQVAASQKDIQWSAAHAMLLQKWQSSKNNKDVIYMDDTALEKLPSPAQPLPSSISAIFKILDDSIVLEHIGGATSNAVLGRFSVFHKEIETCCRNVAAVESGFNTDVLFAEIVSVQDTHAANIEKRKHFYDYEIPVLSISTLPYEQQIQLNDLHLIVRNNRIILFSAKHGKEVVPKLSTAFNYKRSTLGVYRFLCDLQYQGLQKIRPFQMSHFFPDLPFYPRVMYRNTVLQLATWHIKKEEIQHILKEKNETQKVKQLSNYFNNLGVPDVFALKEHDNKLVFKLNDPDDVLSLMENIKTIDRFTIEEFPFIDENALVKDKAGNGYQHEFIATLINRSTIYQGNQTLIQQALSAQCNNAVSFMPGSNWVYLKIYCHPGFGDTILLKKVKALIKHLKCRAAVEKWFFVRYTDSGFHIRVRVFIPLELQAYALGFLNQSLEKELHLGLISNIQLDTYKPEWERYGRNLLSITEDCFHHGSEWILQLLELQHKGKMDNTEIAMLNIHAIFNAASMTYNTRQELLSKMYQSLQTEHGLDKQDQIELGIKFRNYRERMSQWLNRSSRKQKAQLDFEKTLKNCFAKTGKSNAPSANAWIADLIHMQLNRVFSDQPRKKEMVIYYLMSKWYLAEEKKHLKMHREMMVAV